VKPEFWNDEKLSPLSDTARLFFLGLISMADDCGRLADSEKQIEAFIWPHSDRSRDVRECLAKLTGIGRITRGKAASGMPVVQIVNWAKHQKVDHPNTKSALPEVVEVIEHPEIRESVANHSRKRRDKFASDSRTISVPVPTTSTSTYDLLSPSDEKTSEATGKGGWPAEIAAHWSEKIGDVDPGRVGKRLKRIVEKFDHAVVLAAITAYADEPMGTRPRTLEDFAGNFQRWRKESEIPIVQDGVITPRGERITRPGAIA